MQRGVARFRRACEDRGVADSKPGQKMVAAINRELILALTEAQAEATQITTTAGSGRQPKWIWPILLLTPEKLAVIVVRTLLSRTAGDAPMARVAKLIGDRVRLEREFELFADRQNETEKLVKEVGGKPRNLFKLMKERCETIDERALRRWRKKADELDRVPLSNEDAIHLGAKLLEVAVEKPGGWFEVKLTAIIKRGRRVTERVVSLTEEGQAYLQFYRSELEIMQPWLMPMVCPPVPWTRKS